MKTVAKFYGVRDADALCRVLEQHGINAFIPDEFTGTVQPFITNAIGGIRVQVNDEDYETAARLTAEFLAAPQNESVCSAEEREWTCAQCGEIVEREFDSCWNCGTQRP